MAKAIIIRKLNKIYKLFNSNKERLYSLFSPSKYGESFYALKDVDFIANQGEVIGFVGINGSGKSTLSNIIAGIVPETTGEVQVNGQAALIAVAAGLKNDLSGRDNIELKLLMLGFNKDEISELEPSIIEFAELEKFIDQPVKSYSSGMKSRLGFAISVNVDPDILIIDEALSVGDKAFAQKSLKKMHEFKEDGKTMIFVSHSIGQMKQFCEKILWLEDGQVRDYGKTEEILPKYEIFLSKWQKMTKSERYDYENESITNRNKIIFGDVKLHKIFNSNNENTKIEEKPISLLVKIEETQDFIFKDLENFKSEQSSGMFKNEAFYVKKQIVVNNELMYLLSRAPSSQKEVIGWVKAASVEKRTHTVVDYDKKKFVLNGSGNAYDIPWGKKQNIIYKGLKEYVGKTFYVCETNLVGKGAWYKGFIENDESKKKVWIYGKRLAEFFDNDSDTKIEEKHHD